MGCNCKAKQKIKKVNNYFNFKEDKPKGDISFKQLSSIVLTGTLGIIFLPFTVLTLLFKSKKSKSSTINLDKYFKLNGRK